MNSLTNDYEVDVRQINPTLVVLVASKVGGRYPLALGGPLHLSGLRDQHTKWRETSLFSTFEFRQSRFDQVYSDLIVAPEVLLHLH